jgi:hypothetical protein
MLCQHCGKRGRLNTFHGGIFIRQRNWISYADKLLLVDRGDVPNFLRAASHGAKK